MIYLSVRGLPVHTRPSECCPATSPNGRAYSRFLPAVERTQTACWSMPATLFQMTPFRRSNAILRRDRAEPACGNLASPRLREMTPPLYCQTLRLRYDQYRWRWSVQRWTQSVLNLKLRVF